MKTIAYSIKIFFLLFFFLSLMTCKEDDQYQRDLPGISAYSNTIDVCVDTFKLEEVFLLPESRKFFLYDTITKIVFINKAGNLTSFNKINSFNEGSFNYFEIRECSLNPEEDIRFEHSFHYLFSTFRNDDLEMLMETNLSALYNLDDPEKPLVYDAINIRLETTNEFTYNEYGDLLLAKRDLQADIVTNLEHFPSLEILGETFYDVYASKHPENVFLYTKEQGFIGFHDWIGNIWKLKYTE